MPHHWHKPQLSMKYDQEQYSAKHSFDKCAGIRPIRIGEAFYQGGRKILILKWITEDQRIGDETQVSLAQTVFAKNSTMASAIRFFRSRSLSSTVWTAEVNFHGTERRASRKVEKRKGSKLISRAGRIQLRTPRNFTTSFESLSLISAPGLLFVLSYAPNCLNERLLFPFMCIYHRFVYLQLR